MTERERTYELLTIVREPLPEERKGLEAKGFVFLSVEAKTLAQVVSERPSHFWNGELDYINGRSYPDLREYTPLAMSVAYNPDQLFVPDSCSNSQERQLRTTEKYSREEIETQFPDAKALVLPATVSAQADIAYFDRTGKALLGNRCAGALDKSVGSFVVLVSRNLPGRQLDVFDWYAGYSRGGVGVPLALVFLNRSKTVT